VTRHLAAFLDDHADALRTAVTDGTTAGAGVPVPDAVLLNGVAVADPAQALGPLMQSPDDPVLLTAARGASVQRLLDVMTALRQAGLTTLALVETE
jgi:hypothetical protein